MQMPLRLSVPWALSGRERPLRQKIRFRAGKAPRSCYKIASPPLAISKSLGTFPTLSLSSLAPTPVTESHNCHPERSEGSLRLTRTKREL